MIVMSFLRVLWILFSPTLYVDWVDPNNLSYRCFDTAAFCVGRKIYSGNKTKIYIDNRKNKQTKTFPQKQIKNKLHKEEDESKAFSIEPDRTSWIRTDKKKNTQFYFSTLITCRPYWDIQVIDSAHGNMWNCFFIGS